MKKSEQKTMMDSLKLRNSSKLSKMNSAETPKKIELKLNDDEKKTIAELKSLYMETIELDVELQRQIYNMEKAFEEKHNEIFNKRQQILDNIRKRETGDSAEQPNLINFWLKVLKSSYTEFISKKDEKILANLVDIRIQLHNEPQVKFVIEFIFEPNEYFSNRIITKSYFLNCLPDSDDPLSYDGAEIYKCEGCEIDWKKENRDKDNKTFSSFFDFFNPPQLPADPSDPSYYEINAVLQNDFELGFYLKERVIPKAIMFFTGEISDCQTSDEETEITTDDDECAEEEETEDSKDTAEAD